MANGGSAAAERVLPIPDCLDKVSTLQARLVELVEAMHVVNTVPELPFSDKRAAEGKGQIRSLRENCSSVS